MSSSSSPDHLKRLLQSDDPAALNAYVSEHAANSGFHLELFHIYRHNGDDLALRLKAADLQRETIGSRLALMIPEFGQGSAVARMEIETLSTQLHALMQSADCPEELKVRCAMRLLLLLLSAGALRVSVLTSALCLCATLQPTLQAISDIIRAAYREFAHACL